MVLRDGAHFIVRLCQPQGLAARNAPLRLLVSSVPVCANIRSNMWSVPVCDNVRQCASVCQRCDVVLREPGWMSLSR
jgi:hypothetical protein